MTEMIERIKAAIADAMAIAYANDMTVEQGRRLAAIYALKAVRDPTIEMRDAGRVERWYSGSAVAVYQTMIDCAIGKEQ